jgi:hypothetical protein
MNHDSEEANARIEQLQDELCLKDDQAEEI